MVGISKLDYVCCVSIVMGVVFKEMVLLGVFVVGLLVVVGFIFCNFSLVYGLGLEVFLVGLYFMVLMINGVLVNLGGVEVVVGLLMVGMIFGILFVMLMNNGGGVWDNVKKWIEIGVYGGKKLDVYKVVVVGDMVGDLFKDIVGLLLYVFIKLLVMIMLVFVLLFL